MADPQQRLAGGRVLDEPFRVVAVEDLQTGPESSAFTVTELFSRERPDQPLRWTTNVPSRALLLRTGFQQEGYARNYLLIDGKRQDHLLFAILREDWRG